MTPGLALSFGAALTLGAALFISPPPMSDSPLPPCASTLNCYAASRTYNWAPNMLMEATVAAVRSLSGLTIGSASEITRDTDDLGLHAVFRVFLFDDDLQIRIVPSESGTVLWVRSASRVGRSDLGTNRRRVEALLDCLEED